MAGIGLGQMLNLGRVIPGSPAPRDAVVVEAPIARGGNPSVIPASFNEETAMRELDEIAVPRYDALRAYDTFTPRAADYIQPR
jgi:hypothetical protein